MRWTVSSLLFSGWLALCILYAPHFLEAQVGDVDGSCIVNDDGGSDSCNANLDDAATGESAETPEKTKLQRPPVDGSDLGEPQRILPGEENKINVKALKGHIEQARAYMQSAELTNKRLGPQVMEHCRNQHEHCAYWSLLGECEANPGYMKLNCAPVCRSCDYLTLEGRCDMTDRSEDTWAPGDLEGMFRRLTNEPFLSKHTVQILSSPETKDGGPWVITLENVFSEEEAQILIGVGEKEGYKRSLDAGPVKFDGTITDVESKDRTSFNAWCNSDECQRNDTVQDVTNKISGLVGIPSVNSEHFQMLRYEVGQFYNTHHDYIGVDTERQPGPRILTVFLYLNEVEQGGGTHFSDLNITVMPKVGRALLWPSVLDEDPSRKDERTYHQALPVEKGVKFGTNMWFHLRDFKTPHNNACV